MKKQLSFMDEYGKWLVRLMVLVGFWYILKLFLIGLHTYCSSSLCIVSDFDYYWITASTVGLFLIILISFISLYIDSKKNIYINIMIAFFIMILGLFGKQIFYFFSEDFKFYDHGKLEYTDNSGRITNMDLYLENMKKYCDNSIDNFKFKRVYREDMCGGQYVINFDTTEEYIKVLDFANKNNLKFLYKITLNGVENFGMKKIIEKYNDDTFYARIINSSSDINILKLILNNSKNDNIINIVDFNIQKLFEYSEKNKSMTDYEKDNFIFSMNQEVEYNIRNLNGINDELILYINKPINYYIDGLNDALIVNNISGFNDLLKDAESLKTNNSTSNYIYNENYLIKELIKKYNNKIFQIEVLKSNTSVLQYVKGIKENSFDQEVSDLAYYIIKNNSNKESKDFKLEIDEKIKNMTGIDKYIINNYGIKK